MGNIDFKKYNEKTPTNLDSLRIFQTRNLKFGQAILLGLLALVLIGGFIFYLEYNKYKEYINYISNEEDVKEVVIPTGASVTDVAQILAEEEVIPNTKIFGIETYKIYFRFNPIDETNLNSGTFTIPEGKNIRQIFSSFKTEGCNELPVTLIEGMRLEEYGKILEKVYKDNFQYEKFVSFAKNFTNPNSLEFAFPLPEDGDLEGYLFPDTYIFCEDIDEIGILERLLKNFEQKYINSLQKQLINSNLTLEEVVNIASMLEREAKTLEDKKMIADLMLRRIQDEMPLGIDATTQYEYGFSSTQNSWWRKGSELDQVIDTPHTYSTRQNIGLPPTPISNPGLDSMLAVLSPTPNTYYYYVSDENENIFYGETLQDHNYNICKHINKECQ